MANLDAGELLPFQVDMFRALTDEPDVALILARGLGYQRLLLNLLRLYCDPRMLVLVINAPEALRAALVDRLVLDGHPRAPRVLTSSTPNSDRYDVYLEGGVVFVTSRILVVDFLTRRVPSDVITGIVVCSCHTVVPMSTEAFILRLFRHSNRTGFIKAITESPEQLQGFNALEKLLKTTWLRKISFWPRFEKSLKEALELDPPEVVEVKVPLTDRMANIQQAISELMTSCLRELKRTRPGLDMSQLEEERSLFSAFDIALRRQLDPVWHKLGSKTRQLVADLRTLRSLANYLHQYDCVSFFHYLETLRCSQYAFNSHSYFLHLDATENLYVNAKYRVFETPTRPDASSAPAAEAAPRPQSLQPRLEPNPKWHSLAQLLEEIEELIASGTEQIIDNPRVLICCNDSRTCSQLQTFLQQGEQKTLERQLKRFNKWRQRIDKLNASGTFAVSSKQPDVGGAEEAARAARQQSAAPAAPASASTGKTRARGKRRRIEQAVMIAGTAEAALRVMQQDDNELLFDANGPAFGDGDGDVDDDEEATIIQERDPFKEFEENFSVIAGGFAVILSMQSNSSVSKYLDEMQPQFIIMYDPNLACSREIEVYKASRPGVPVRVYFMLYSQSLQEQRYLSAIRLETHAFEMMVRAKSSMAISEDQDGRSGHRQDLENQMHVVVETSSRKAGGQSVEVTPEIVVDMREFRSSLPAVIHEHNFKLKPMTLLVGDFVLSPDMCVERKSVPDLIQSLASGRLYNQVTAMSRYYSIPILLIEMDENRSNFSLVSSTEYVAGDVDFRNTLSKLVLLTITFPHLRLVWSRSAYATAKTFRILKRHQPQPDASTAAEHGEDTDAVDREGYASGPQAFLRMLPGVTAKNIRKIMEKTTNLKELSTMPLERMERLMGASNGKQLYAFFHNKK
eukprot:m.184488 g.184488  ORF g.184488 m.184488 type:complete len:911 (-) comp10509_c0_seq8:183-2915(-)